MNPQPQGLGRTSQPSEQVQINREPERRGSDRRKLLEEIAEKVVMLHFLFVALQHRVIDKEVTGCLKKI